MNSSHILAITFLLAMPPLHGMEVEELNENIAQQFKNLPAEIQAQISSYLENGLTITQQQTAVWDGSAVVALYHLAVLTERKNEIVFWNILPVLAAQACKNRLLTIKQWLMLKELYDNNTNKPLYLNANGKKRFDSLRSTVDESGKKEDGIDDFYTLLKPKFNDTETDETKKRWRIVPKTFNPKKLEEAQGKDEVE